MEDNTTTEIKVKSMADQFKDHGIEYTPPVVPAVETNEANKEKVLPTSNTNTPEASNTNPVINWEEKYKAIEAELALAKNNKEVVKVVLTPEEIAAELEKENKEFKNYVVLEKNLNATDLELFQKVKDLPAKDYVYAEYLAERKLENPDLNEEEIKADFDAEYGFSSTDARILKKAEQLVNLEAKELKAEKFKAFFPLENEFKTVKQIKAKLPVFSKMVEEANPKLTVSIQPEGFDEPISLDIDITEDIKDLKAKLLKDPIFFTEFTKEGVDTAKSIEEYLLGEAEGKHVKSGKITKMLTDNAIETLTKKLKIGSVHPHVAQNAGSNTENVANTIPGITALLIKEGFTPPTAK